MMLIGTYTRGTDSQGIYRVAADGSVALAAETDNPSFLASHPSLPVIYSVNESGDFQQGGGAVSAFRITSDRRLAAINQVASLGADPCHLFVDPAGRFLVVANYNGGSFTVLELGDNGRLGGVVSHVQHTGRSVNPVRQTAAHVHSTRLLDNHLVVADLGIDCLMVYPVDESGYVDEATGKRISARPGAGPRHTAISADRRCVYLINELDSTVSRFRVTDGLLSVVGDPVATLPIESARASITAEVAATRDGKWLIASNRGHDSLTCFRVADEALDRVCNVSSGGGHPRHFAVVGDEVIVANRDSDQLVWFSLNRHSGALEATGRRVSVPTPVFVLLT